MTLKVINLDTPTLGDRSYIAHDGKSALVVDPQRDIDRVIDLLDHEGVSLGVALNAACRLPASAALNLVEAAVLLGQVP